MPSNIGWNIFLGYIVAFIGVEEVRDIKKPIDGSILVSIVCRECLKIIVEVLGERNV